MAKKIKAKRLRWADNVVRMKPETPSKKVFPSDPDGEEDAVALKPDGWT